MTRARKALLVAAALLAVVVGGILWMLGTDSGTRWLLGQAARFMPDELVIGDTQGSLLGGVRAESVEWRGQPFYLHVHDAYVEVQLLALIGGRVAIDELDVEQVDMTVVAAGEKESAGTLPVVDLPVDLSIAAASVRNIAITTDKVNRKIDSVSLAGNLLGTDLSLTDLELRSAWLDLDVSGRVRFGGRYPAAIDADWRWKDSDAEAFAGQLRIAGDLRRYALQHGLTAPLAITTAGHVSYVSEVLEADLTSVWQSLDWPLEQGHLYSSQGTLRLSGTLDSFAVDLDTNARLDDQPDTRIKLNGDAGPDRILITELIAENRFGRLVAEGSSSWMPERKFDLAYAISGLDPSSLQDAVSGDVQLDGRVVGVLTDQGPNVDLFIEHVSGDINGFPLQGEAELRFAGDTLSVSGTQISLGSNTVSVDGRISESIALGVEFAIADFAEILPDASGALDGELRLRGQREKPDIRVNLKGSGIDWRGYSLASLTVNGDISSTRDGVADLRLAQLGVGDVVLDAAEVSVSGRLGAHNLRASVRGYRSELVLDAAGAYAKETWSGQLTSLAVDNDEYGRWSTAAASELQVALTEAAIAETCVVAAVDAAKACFSIRYLADGPSLLDINATGLPLGAMPISLPDGVTLSGYIDARVHGEKTNGLVEAQADIELREATLEGTYDDERLVLNFSKAIGQFGLANKRIDSDVQLETADGMVTGRLQLALVDVTNPQAAIAGQGSVAIKDAALVAILVPGVSNPRGNINGTVAIAGALNAPELVGEIALVDGAFGFRRTGIEVTGIDVRLQQLEPGQLRLLGSARSGDGQIAIQGRTEFALDTGLRAELQLTGENFELSRLPDWQIAASPSIDLVLDDQTASITGSLTIPTANITVREIPETAQTSSPDAVVHRSQADEPAPGRRITIDIQTELGNDVQLTGFGLTTGINGSVRLQGGSHSAYTGRGRLLLRDGRYTAYGQKLEIERGELIFNGPLDNPQLDIRAIRRAQDVVAGIQLSGVPSALESEVFSEPSMSDAEALSYLLTGRPLASVSSGEGDILNNAAFALGISGAGSIASQLRTELGLDTLTVVGGADDSRLIAGKRLSDRLLIEYGYGLIDKLGTLVLRYQLNNRLTLESRTGTVSNLDLVYSVKKK